MSTDKTLTACTILSMKAEFEAMKTVIVALLASCIISFAQTNTNNSGSTLDKYAPLHATQQLLNAAESNDVKTVKLLLENGADVNAKGTNGITALMSAAWGGSVEIIKLLFEKGADVNTKGNFPYKGHTALMSAASVGSVEIIRLLLARGADVNAKDDMDDTALSVAAMSNHRDAVEFLLDKGATNGTALRWAASSGSVEIINLLLADGADVNGKDKGGETALMSAALHGKFEAVKLLLERGAFVNGNGGMSGTALISAAYSGQTNVVEILLDYGADINVNEMFGGTPLITAVQEDKIEVIKLLLAKGADIHAKGSDGQIALDVAKKRGNQAIVQLLQQAENPVNTVVAFGTNTDSSGYVTNAALLIPFTLTNSAGDVITNAVLVKLMPSKFIYKTPDGAMKMQRLDSLSEDLQEKFGYNSSMAQAADISEEQKKERLQQLYQQQQSAANVQARWDAALVTALDHKGRLEGKVIQKISDGLLVSMNDRIYLLKDYPGYDQTVADDYVKYPTFGIGNYTYETVNKSENTIRVLTCSTNVAVNYYLTH